MKCEIIDGKLVIERGTPTEIWAVQNWFENMPSWQRVNEAVKLEPDPALKVKPETKPHPTDDFDPFAPDSN